MTKFVSYLSYDDTLKDKEEKARAKQRKVHVDEHNMISKKQKVKGWWGRALLRALKMWIKSKSLIFMLEINSREIWKRGKILHENRDI